MANLAVSWASPWDPASELEYLLLLGRDLGLLEEQASRDLIGSTIEIKRMLASLAKKVKADR